MTENEKGKKDQHQKTVDELLKEIDRHSEAATKNISDGMDKITDALIKASPSEAQKIANALSEVDIGKGDSSKNGLLNRLFKTRGKKVIALLATLGVMALGYSLKSNEKQSRENNLPKVQDVVPPHTTQDKTLAVLDALIRDQHAFDGIEIKDSMQSDNVMMNTKILDVLEGAFKQAGYLDENGNLKPMKMLDISKADALDALKGGLKAPQVYSEKRIKGNRKD